MTRKRQAILVNLASLTGITLVGFLFPETNIWVFLFSALIAISLANLGVFRWAPAAGRKRNRVGSGVGLAILSILLLAAALLIEWHLRRQNKGRGGRRCKRSLRRHGEPPVPVPIPMHFTGKERDAESGLDYFGARHYTSMMGRFMSADWSAIPEPVPYAKFNAPQSLNLYTYTGNNPVSLTDPDGHLAGGITMNPENDPPVEACEPVDHQCSTGPNDAATLTGNQVASSAVTQQSQQQSQQQSPNPGRQPDGSYVAATGPGSEIANIIDPATPVPAMIGNGQCVTACAHLSGVTADTKTWTEGPAVANNDSIPIGTAIATFGSNGHYPTSGDQNSGIYMGQGKNGSIKILDQWPAHRQSGTPDHHPSIRTLRFNDGKTLSNSASAYHVIIIPR